MFVESVEVFEINKLPRIHVKSGGKVLDEQVQPAYQKAMCLVTFFLSVNNSNHT